MAKPKPSRTIWPRVPASLVKGQLLAHKLLGLVLAAVMYLVCVTGTVAVFYGEFQRWETPGVPETSRVTPEAIGRAVADARQQIARKGHKPLDVYVITPSPEMPRLIVDYEPDALSYDAEGRPAGPGAHELTHFLTELHYELNLPATIGFTMVGVLGVLLVALIVGGSLALPRMFRDAFTLRIDGGRRLSRVDIHNRIAVWGLPFHFIVALSGAIMGLAFLLLAIAAPTKFGGDAGKAMTAIYGDPKAVAAEAKKGGPPPALATPEPRLVAALTAFERAHPDKPPIYLTLTGFGTPSEGLTISAAHGDRLIYSEGYRTNSAGAVMSQEGYSNGEVGRQVYGSMFRLHAGAFGGMAVKLIYVLLGLGLSFLCTTGVDIWLVKSAEKGRAYPRVQSAWTTFVWATPALVALGAASALVGGIAPALFFWIGLTLVTLAGMWLDQKVLHWLAPLVAGLATASLPLAHIAKHGDAAFSPIGGAVNAGLGLTAVVIVALAARNWAKQRRVSARAAVLAPAE